MKCLRRMILLATLGIAVGTSVGTVMAGACTYGEALMAMEQNNTVRAMALMRMASADGDIRATAFLAGQTQVPFLLASATQTISRNVASEQVRLAPR